MLHERTYKVGDPVLIWLSNHDGEMSEGRVIFSFVHEGLTLYVIEFETAMGSHYECRSGSLLTMRPAAGSQEYDSWHSPQQCAKTEKP